MHAIKYPGAAGTYCVIIIRSSVGFHDNGDEDDEEDVWKKTFLRLIGNHFVNTFQNDIDEKNFNDDELFLRLFFFADTAVRSLL